MSEGTAATTSTFRWLALISLLALLAGFWVPGMRLKAIVICAVIPWCALVVGLRYRGEIAVALRTRRDGSAAGPMVIATIALASFALDDLGLISSRGVIEWGLFVGLPMWFAFFYLVSKPDASIFQTFGAALIFLPVAWIYGGSLLALSNCFMDHASPQVFQTQVIGKHVSYAKSERKYYLELQAWGPRSDGSNLRVDYERYEDAKNGDRICLGLYPGRFGQPWAHSIACPHAGPGNS
ncbi:hypothetical protein EKH79_13255 [Dyella dinghuensis]|uniref:Uncharacterized protein n=1 Tax=Dyella dinghuensis TaxID=1920169 RepID=A0A3S0RSN5_9GAMM|nr:hypothetical protein [Dyella dinghuensis]RUL63355.1 hypothetical protein EKH79_13255 [Dyella dinghuensis]